MVDKTRIMMTDIKNIIAESVELLKDMVAIKSPSFEEDAVCSHICEWMSKKDIRHRRIGNNIIAEHIIDAEKPVLMLCAHIDTVSPSPDYSFDPYNPDYEKAAESVSLLLGKHVKPDEIVAGLGSNDDGASVVTMIAVYRYFTERHSLAEAASEKFIVPAPDQFVRQTFEEMMERSGVRSIQPALMMDSAESAKRVCAACQMVMLCPFITLLTDASSMQRLSHYHLSGESYPYKLLFAHPADTPLTSYAEALCTLMTNRFRAMSAYRV